MDEAVGLSCIFVGALLDWWIPYFFGYGAEERAARYEQMFADTHSFLPVMNGIAPNTIHVIFHTILLFCILLSLYLSLTNKKKWNTFQHHAMSTASSTVKKNE